ncbi:MAG: hypothetical protein HC797_04570 [Anaerolineales bacterium]|nr:hypothetical protein [Anaerolineales bacterium]
MLNISNTEDEEPAVLDNPKPYSFLAGALALGLAACALVTAYWAIMRGPDLLTRTDNPRRAIADRYVPRGAIVDKNNQPINVTEKETDEFIRKYIYPELAPITGYTHPVYGQAGLEASLDSYLRGLQGNPSSLILWDQLLYGTPPSGLDIRLSLDLSLQSKADQLLGGHHGAIILLHAETGEILVMASHPTYDPNKLDAEGEALSQNPNAPLLNRATQGLYPIGTALLPLIRAEFGEDQPTDSELKSFYESLGLYQAPQTNMPVAFDEENIQVDNLRASPLQINLAAAALSNDGLIPAPRIATAVNTLEQGWVVLPALSQPAQVIQAETSNEAVLSFVKSGNPYWSHIGQASLDETIVTWLIAGTLPDWQGAPLTLVVVLEENNIPLAEFIGKNLMAE